MIQTRSDWPVVRSECSVVCSAFLWAVVAWFQTGRIGVTGSQLTLRGSQLATRPEIGQERSQKPFFLASFQGIIDVHKFLTILRRQEINDSLTAITELMCGKVMCPTRQPNA